MSEPIKPTSRPTLLDVYVKRKTPKSPFLRKLERQQSATREDTAKVHAQWEAARRRFLDTNPLRGVSTSDGKPVKPRQTLTLSWPSNVTPIRGDK